MSELRVERCTGKSLEQYLPELARLRIEVFRDFPYLYDGDYAYEQNYLRTYVEATDAVIVLAFDGPRVVGASTGLPMEQETPEFQRPFVEYGYAPSKIFYCSESVLQPDYRGRGLYKCFFQGREEHAKALGQFEYCAFCCVDRPANHPRRPPDYQPLDAVWRHFGYTRHPELTATYTWKDLDDDQESPKTMVFWLKPLQPVLAL